MQAAIILKRFYIVSINTGVPFRTGERRISPGGNDLRLLNSPEFISHNNHILKSLNICFQDKVHLVRYTLHKYVYHDIVINKIGVAK